MVSTTISLDNKSTAVASANHTAPAVAAAAAAAAANADSNAIFHPVTFPSHRGNSTSVSGHNTKPVANHHNLHIASKFAARSKSSGVAQLNPAEAATASLTSSAATLNEKISILFPKCRPKSDINSLVVSTAPSTRPINSGVTFSAASSMHSANHYRGHTSSSKDTTTSPTTNTTTTSAATRATNHLNNNNHYINNIPNNQQHQEATAMHPSHGAPSNPHEASVVNSSQTTITNNTDDSAPMLTNQKTSPNISTNPFLSRHPNDKVSYYYKSPTTNKDVDHFAAATNPATYTQKLLYQKQQQQQQQQRDSDQMFQLQHHQQQPGQNPFMTVNNQPNNKPSDASSPSASLHHQWEPRRRYTNNTTPSSTVLNSPDLIESTDSRLNLQNGGYHNKMAPAPHIRVGRSPVNHQQFYQLQQQHQQQQQQQNKLMAAAQYPKSHHQIANNVAHHHSAYSSYMGIDIDRFPTLSPSPSSLIADGHNEDDEDGADATDHHQRRRSPLGLDSTDGAAASSSSKMAVMADGEVVVFDDLGENWQSLRIAAESPPQPKQPPPPPPKLNCGKQDEEIDDPEDDHEEEEEEEQEPHSDYRPVEFKNYKNVGTKAAATTRSNVSQDDDYLEQSQQSAARSTIGSNVSPSNNNKNRAGESLRGFSGIMEYDGSPRRFGQLQQPNTTDLTSPNTTHNSTTHLYSASATSNSLKTVSSSLFSSSPRPGFPHRVVLSPSDATTAPTMSATPSIAVVHTDDTSNDISEMATSSDATLSLDAQSTAAAQSAVRNSTFDYLYEFSETRKVLEEFFKNPSASEDRMLDGGGSDVDSIDIHYEFKGAHEPQDFATYIGQRLASTSPYEEYNNTEAGSPSPPNHNNKHNGYGKQSLELTEDEVSKDVDYFLDSASRSSGGEPLDNDLKLMAGGGGGGRSDSRCFRYSPETTDYDSNCGDLDSLSGDFNVSNSYPTNYSKYYASMPILEDGLSSGHASDTENNNPTGISLVMDMRGGESLHGRSNGGAGDGCADLGADDDADSYGNGMQHNGLPMRTLGGAGGDAHQAGRQLNNKYGDDPISEDELREFNRQHMESRDTMLHSPKNKIFKNVDSELDSLYSINMVQLTPPPPAPAPHRNPSLISCSSSDVQSTLKDIKSTLERTKALTGALAPEDKRADNNKMPSPTMCSPIWIPRHFDNSGESLESDPVLKNMSGDEEEVDTDLETDRLLGHQRLEDHGFYDEKNWCERKQRSLLSKFSPKTQNLAPNSGSSGSTGSTSILRQGLNALLPSTPEIVLPAATALVSAAHSTPTAVTSVTTIAPTLMTNNMTTTNSSTSKLLDIGGSMSSPEHSDKSPINTIDMPLNNDSPTGSTGSANGKQDVDKKKKSKNKEVLIEGVLFRARYLGSTQLVCEGQPTKSTRMVQAEEAVSRIKAPDGEVQPSTEVDLFISTEKIMVLNTDLKEIMMDHALRTISYIADIGDLVVLMARRRFVPNEIDDAPKPNRTPKMICHVFESDEAQFIAQSIGQAFQVAYMEFLKANGIEDHSFVKEMDYQEVLNSQEIFGDELEIFAKKELQKEVVVPKAKGEILGVVIVESGWGSMLPTVVIANLLSSGAAARCGQLNIGDQIIAINGMSLVGLPLSTCQTYIKNTKAQTVVKFTVVPCAPVVEVKIKRPNTKYQLGFSVQNGVICSLLRGGIAERGGVRVGHRIIEINNQSVVAVPHEKIVNLLATSVGEILMKTMPTSMFRLLTGQENPVYI